MKIIPIFFYTFPAEPRQALRLLSSIALSSWRVRAENIVCPKLRWKTHYTNLFKLLYL